MPSTHPPDSDFGLTPGRRRARSMATALFVAGRVILHTPVDAAAVRAAAEPAFGDRVDVADGAGTEPARLLPATVRPGGLVVRVWRRGAGQTLHCTADGVHADVATMRQFARRLAGDGDDADPAGPGLADVAAWLDGLGDASEGAAARDYWRAQETPDVSAILDRPVAPDGRFRPAEVDVDLPAGPASQGRLLACWQALLLRLTGLPELTVAVAVDLRTVDPGLATLPGGLTEYLPLKAAADARLSALTERAVGALAAAHESAEWFDHRQCVAGAGTPFGFDIEPGDPLLDDVAACTERFALRLSIYDGARGPGARLWYDAGVLDPADAADLAAAVAETFAAAPDARICDLPALGPAQWERVTTGWAVGAPAALPDATVVEMVDRSVRRTPTATAVVDGEELVTYAALSADADRVAGWLRQRGVRRGDYVGVCMERSARYVATLLGVLRAGAAFVGLDPRYPADRLAYMAGDAHAVLVVTDPATMPLTDRFPCPVALVPPPDAAAPPVRCPAGPHDVAYLAYSSGSTGRPKGAAVGHHGAVNVLHWLAGELALGVGDRVLHHSSISFDVAVRELFVPLVRSATVVIAPPGTSSDPELFVEVARTHRVSACYVVSSMVRPLVDQPGFPALRDLRVLMCGAESLSAQALRRFHERSGGRLIQVYGPCESTMNATAWRADRAWAGALPPIGGPIPNLVLRLLDTELNPAPVGVPAELYIGGAGVGHGYAGHPGQTAERFVPDPLGAGRLYRTGDVARWRADGTVEFLGRHDDQVKIRGVRVELGEVESALRDHPAVREAVVTAVDGNGVRRLAAYLVPAGADRPDQQALRGWLGERLTDAMIPSFAVWLDVLPRTPNGKVQRSALPDPQAIGTAVPYRAPTTMAERVLAEVWAQVLDVPRVGVDDNFFELGGDSILAILILARAAERGYKITPTQFLSYQTIAESAACAVTPQAAAGPPAVAVEPTLSPVQRRFFDSGPDEPGHHHQGWHLELDSDLDPGRLGAAVDAVVAHHEALRLTFRPDPGAPSGWRPRLATPARSAFTGSLDLRGLQAPFDLAESPLLRVALAGARLVLVAHHLVVDAVSWRVLLADLRDAYAQLAAGRPVQLGPVHTSFAQWVDRLRADCAAGGFDADAGYWTALTDEPPLPVDLPGAGSLPRHRDLDHVDIELDPEPTGLLLGRLPVRYRAGMHEALLAALARAVTGWTGNPRLLVALETHGREDLAGLDHGRTVGWFTAISPALLRLPQGDLDESIPLVKEQIRAVPRHGLSYGVLRYLRDDAVSAHLATLRPAVRLNYLGRYAERDEHAGIAWRPAHPPLDRLSAAGNSTPYLLDVLAAVEDGRLRARLSYSRAHHRPETAQLLADRMRADLEALAKLCADPTPARLTPSDFPLLDIDQRGLDAVLTRAASRRR